MRFLDGTRVTVTGLNEIMEHLHAEGRQPNPGTAEEILGLLQAARNYISSSVVARREYAHILLEEYRSYVAAKKEGGERR